MKKVQTSIRDMTVISTIPHEYHDVLGYLSMVHRNCEKLKDIGKRACSVLLYLHHNDSTLSGLQHSAVNDVVNFRLLHPNFKVEYVETQRETSFSSLISLTHSTANNDILLFLPADARTDLDFFLRLWVLFPISC